MQDWDKILDTVTRQHPPTVAGLRDAVKHAMQLTLCQTERVCQNTSDTLQEEYGQPMMLEGVASVKDALQEQLTGLRERHGDFTPALATVEDEG